MNPKRTAMILSAAAAGAVLLIAGLGLLRTRTEQAPALVLRIGTTARIRSANILLDSSLSLLAHLSNPPLMRISDTGHPEGLLAADAAASADKTTWTFTLRPGLFWSDGRRVTADDVRFTLLYIRQESPSAGWFKEVLDRVTIKDERTVEIHLTKPYARLNREFATYIILPQHIWSHVASPREYVNPGPNVGCGPFTIRSVDLIRGVVTFQPNPYWEGQGPIIERIEIHLFQNLEVLALALERGTIDTFYDYAASYPYHGLEKLRRRGRFEFDEVSSRGLTFLGMNLSKSPMSDASFREALSAAVNYPEIVKLILLGHGMVPHRGFVPIGTEHYLETPRMEYDPSRTEALLDAAGFKDRDGDGQREDAGGAGLILELLARTEHARLAELLRGHFTAVGIRIIIKTVETSSWASLKDRYRYDLIIGRTTPWGMQMHAGWGSGYFDARRTGAGVLHIVDDPEFFSICDDLLGSGSEAETERGARSIQEYYSTRLPALPLYWERQVAPFNRRFRGWSLSPLYGIYHPENFLNLRPTAP